MHKNGWQKDLYDHNHMLLFVNAQFFFLGIEIKNITPE